MKLLVLFVLLLTACSAVQPTAEIPKSFIHVKRISQWVPDLDRAIVFYRDVLGFELVLLGSLEVAEDSVLFDLFNLDQGSKVRRAIFSSSTEERALFVMEAPGAPEYSSNDKRFSVPVIRVGDLKAVEIRARALGFTVGASNIEVSLSAGEEFRETVIIGPGGQAVLLYQFSK